MKTPQEEWFSEKFSGKYFFQKFKISKVYLEPSRRSLNNDFCKNS